MGRGRYTMCDFLKGKESADLLYYDFPKTSIPRETTSLKKVFFERLNILSQQLFSVTLKIIIILLFAPSSGSFVWLFYF